MIFFLHITEQLGVVATFVLYQANFRTTFSEIVEPRLVGINSAGARSSALHDIDVSRKMNIFAEILII